MRPPHIKRPIGRNNKISRKLISGNKANSILRSGGVSARAKKTRITGDVTGRDKYDQSTNGFVIVNGNAVIVERASFAKEHGKRPTARLKRTKVGRNQ